MFRACERFGVRPPGIKQSWEEMDCFSQADLIAYDEIRAIEETEWQVELAKAGMHI